MSYVQSSSGTPLDASEMHSLTLVTERPNCAMSAKHRALNLPTELFSVRTVRVVPLPGEIDRHHRKTHTDARSAKKDVISTKPQKAMDAVRTFPREHRERQKPNLLAK